MCDGLWWQDLPCNHPGLFEKMAFERKIGRLATSDYPPPQGAEHATQHGILMILPIFELCVIRGRNPTDAKRRPKTFRQPVKAVCPFFKK
jgi:hypothetical protein